MRAASAPGVQPWPGINAGLAAVHVAMNLYQFFVVPLVLMPFSPWWALSVVPLVAANNPLWSLIHETIHDSFHASARINRAAGRVLAIAFGSPWRILRTGHMLHHRFNRTALDRPDEFDPARGSPALAALGYYWQLLIGLYVSQILSPIAFFLPRRALDRARARFLDPDSSAGHAAAALTRDGALAEIRVDGTVIYLLLGASMICYGSYWWVVLAMLAARAVCISFLDYVYHYGTRTDELMHARNLRLPSPIAGLLLNFNLHGVHHRRPYLPWHALPAAFRDDGDRYDGDYLAAAVGQLRGPVPRATLAALAEREA